MNNAPVTLSIRHGERVSRSTALELLAGVEGAVVLGYSPSSCVLAVCANGRWEWWDRRLDRPEECLFTGVYELRVFCKAGEIRWLNDSAQGRARRDDALGSAAAVWESPAPPMHDGRTFAKLIPHDWQVAADEPVEPLDNRYLLWGEACDLWRNASDAGSEVSQRWSCLAEGRIGRLHVPVAGALPLQGDKPRKGDDAREDRHHVWLHTREYIGPEPGLAGEHGNCAILAERLIRLEAGSGVVDRESPG